MASQVVKPENLGAEFETTGAIETGKIRLKIGAGLNRLADGTVVATAAIVKSPLYEYREIWAEEGGGLNANSAEWSYGNGAVGFMGLPIDDGWEVVELGFNADTYAATSTVTIDLMSYNTPSNAAGNTIASLSLADATDGGGATNNAYKHEVLDTPEPVPGGVIGFLTRSVTGTISDVRAYARLRRQSGEYVSDVSFQ